MSDQLQDSRIEAGPPSSSGEQGFMLLGLIVVIAIILLGLSVAASKVAFSLHREREVESARRADQYVRAIRRYYLKNNHYPGAIEQLEKGIGVRYLRQRYVDPLTGKADYRLIPVGQNKTTVKGFFGAPLAGLATTGLGSVAGMQSPVVPVPTTTPVPTTNTTGTPATGNGTSDQSGTGLSGSVGPFMGVGSSASGGSILIVNEQTTYESWEFLYDPRIEKLKQAAALNAGVGSGNGLGQLPTANPTPTLTPTPTPAPNPQP
jgi:type II secretory pathway pseudopilin PulG